MLVRVYVASSPAGLATPPTARARESGVRARGSGRPGTTVRRRCPPAAVRVRGGGAGPIAAGRPARVPSAPLRKDAT